MKLPVKKLRGLLHKIMYKDVATIYRSVKVKDDDAGVSDFKFRAVCENLPCKLSQYGKELSAHRDDRAQHITEDLRLTCDPEVEIQENDVVDVLHESKTFKLVADLERAATRVPNAKQKFLAHEAGLLKSRAMKNTPVDTGLLRGSWKQTPVNGNSVTFYNNVFYGVFVEFGTRYMQGRHMLRKAVDETKANFAQDGRAIMNSIFGG